MSWFKKNPPLSRFEHQEKMLKELQRRGNERRSRLTPNPVDTINAVMQALAVPGEFEPLFRSILTNVVPESDFIFERQPASDDNIFADFWQRKALFLDNTYHNPRYLSQNSPYAPENLLKYQQCLIDIFSIFVEHLPRAPVSAPLTVPLLTMLKLSRQLALIDGLLEKPFAQDITDLDASTRLTLRRFPWTSRLLLDLSGGGRYEFAPLLKLPIPVPLGDRFSHTHILAKTGSGKTTLLQNLIAFDLNTDAAVVVLDPHKVLVPALSALELNRPVIVVDPIDAPGINIFDVEDTDDLIEQEKRFASVVKMLTYLFREGDTPPTGKQIMVFKYLCRLMLLRSTPERPSTIEDLFQFLVDPAPFQSDIARMPPIARSFFSDFTSKNQEFKNTAAELRYRLQTVFVNPTLSRVFSARKTEVNIASAMDSGALILIDTDQSILQDMHAVFGKIFLALILEAARARDPNAINRPAFVYVDEAHHFLDEQANELLTDARKFKVGCTFAHHDLSQIRYAEIRGALKGCGTKIVAGLNADDATALAADMRSSKDELLAVPKFSFAYYTDGMRHATLVHPKQEPLANFTLGPPRPKQSRSVTPSPPPPEDMTDVY